MFFRRKHGAPPSEQQEQKEHHFDPRAPLLAVSGAFRFVHLFRLDTRSAIGRIPTFEAVSSLSLCYGSVQQGLYGRRCRRLVLAGGGSSSIGNHVWFIDYQTRLVPDKDAIHKGHTATVWAILDLGRPSDDAEKGLGDLIATTSDDRTVRVWPRPELGVPSGSDYPLVSFYGHSYHVRSLSCVPRKNWLVSGSWDKTIRLWDLKSEGIVPGGILRTSPADIPNAVSFGSGQNAIFSAWKDGKLRMFSIDGFECVRTFSGRRSCWSVLLHPKREHLFFSGHSKGEVWLWDVRKEDRCVEREKVHSGAVRRIVYVGGNRFASCSRDSDVKEWSGDDLQVVAGTAAAEGTEISTGGANYALCCLTPFPEELDPSAGTSELEERLRFMLGAGGDESVLYGATGSMFAEVRERSGRCIRMFRNVLIS